MKLSTITFLLSLAGSIDALVLPGQTVPAVISTAVKGKGGGHSGGGGAGGGHGGGGLGHGGGGLGQGGGLGGHTGDGHGGSGGGNGGHSGPKGGHGGSGSGDHVPVPRHYGDSEASVEGGPPKGNNAKQTTCGPPSRTGANQRKHRDEDIERAIKLASAREANGKRIKVVLNKKKKEYPHEYYNTDGLFKSNSACDLENLLEFPVLPGELWVGRDEKQKAGHDRVVFTFTKDDQGNLKSKYCGTIYHITDSKKFDLCK